jgi:uncharacterized protein
MDIQENQSTDRCIITHYTANSITIDQQTYEESLLIRADHCEVLTAQHITDVHIELLSHATEPTPEIFLLGTGTTAVPLPPTILDFLSNKKLPFEFMRTESAIRTFNTLIHDGRKVTAILIQQS